MTIKAFRSDNGVFRAAEFRADLVKHDQTITYCARGAHHQNGVAERHIRTMVDKARTILLNAHAKWPEMVNMELWTFAIRHVVTQWNNTPRRDLQYRTSEEVFNKVPPRANKKQHFKDFHPFGCLVYVLEENLQDGKKEPRWNPRSRVGPENMPQMWPMY